MNFLKTAEEGRNTNRLTCRIRYMLYFMVSILNKAGFFNGEVVNFIPLVCNALYGQARAHQTVVGTLYLQFRARTVLLQH
jgi:hypothetical protein